MPDGRTRPYELSFLNACTSPQGCPLFALSSVSGANARTDRSRNRAGSGGGVLPP